MKVVRLSDLRTGRLYSLGNIPGSHFWWRLGQPQGYSAARGIMSIKNSSDIFWNRTRDPAVCSAVPQTNTLLSAPVYLFTEISLEGRVSQS
jgi:hypothetical protein